MKVYKPMNCLHFLKKCWDRFMAIFYILIKTLKKKRGTINNGNVLIIQWGHIGDALIDARTVAALIEYYRNKGKNVTVAGTEPVKKVFLDILGFCDISFYDLEAHAILDINSIKKVLSGLKADGYESIVSLLPWSGWLSLYVPACVPCNQSWGVFHLRNENILFAVLKKVLSFSYTNKIIVPIDMQQLQRSKLLLSQIGIRGFQTQVLSLPRKRTISKTGNAYISVSVDSMDTARRWLPDYFIELVNKLLSRFTYDVVLTGSNVEQGILLEYNKAFEGSPRVNLTIGKLSIDEWITTIQGSQFVISLDSGTAHMAASLGVICYCLTGVWDGHRVMPYVVDKKTPDTKEPICIYRKDVIVDDLPCYGCFSKRYIGWGNSECSAYCKSGEPCLCMRRITANDVLTAIQDTESRLTV